MEYTHLGRSGLSVSRLCLGTMNFGWKTEEADSHAIMDRALAEGINFFDTANVYGFDAGKGRTEEVLGSWFAQGGERREKTVLATKVYGGMSDWPNDTFLSARNIVRACEASLRRMQHRLDRPLPVPPRRPEDAVGGDLAGLRDARRPGQGALRRLVQPRRLADRRGQRGGRPPATSRAWSASSRTTTCSPGTSSSRCSRPRSTTASASSRGARWPAACSPGCWRRPRADGAATSAPRSGWRSSGRRWSGTRPSAASIGAAPADVGVAWLLHQPAVTAPIVGPRTMEQFEGALPALDVTSTTAQLGRLDEIFPGYKAAPMEYAW